MKNNLLFIDDNLEVLSSIKHTLVEKSKGKAPYQFSTDYFSTNFGESREQKKDGKTQFYVYCCDTPKMGLEVVEELFQHGSPIKVAFVDYELGMGTNGLNIIRQMQDIDPCIETVLMSAHEIELSSLYDDLKFSEQMMFLKKPFSPEELVQLVRCLTGRYMNNVLQLGGKGDDRGWL